LLENEIDISEFKEEALYQAYIMNSHLYARAHTVLLTQIMNQISLDHAMAEVEKISKRQTSEMAKEHLQIKQQAWEGVRESGHLPSDEFLYGKMSSFHKYKEARRKLEEEKFQNDKTSASNGSNKRP